VAKDLDLFSYAPYGGGFVSLPAHGLTLSQEEPATSSGDADSPLSNRVRIGAASRSKKYNQEPWWKTHQGKGAK